MTNSTTENIDTVEAPSATLHRLMLPFRYDGQARRRGELITLTGSAGDQVLLGKNSAEVTYVREFLGTPVPCEADGCGRQFCDRAALRRHVDADHVEGEPAPASALVHFALVTKTFQHHGASALPRTVISVTPAEYADFAAKGWVREHVGPIHPCSTCGASYANQNTLARHAAYVHSADAGRRE